MNKTVITEEMLSELRDRVATGMSDKRLAHTLGVEEMAARIGEIYCPEKVNILRAAALLHDITKELSAEEHKRILRESGMTMSAEMEKAPPTQHSFTASILIPKDYPELADEEIISAVRYHTTGRADMSLVEKIIYLSDYIDCTRTFRDCVALRDMFWGADIAKMTEAERLWHLDRVVLESFEMTIRDLKERNRSISYETEEARDSLYKTINAQR